MSVTNIMKPAFMLVLHELDVFLAFSWRDWSTTIIPGSIFAISAARNTPQLSLSSVISSYLLLIIWLTLFIYTFTLSNQITGVDEDRINKPDRPIPTGKVTVVETKRRRIIAIFAFLMVTAFEPLLLPETICWVVTTAFLNMTYAGKNHWLCKSSIPLFPGTWALLSGSWKTIAPLTPTSKRYIFSLAAWSACNTQISDLRDVEGDTAVRRKTMQVVFGDRQARFIITFLFMPVSFVAIWVGGIVPLAPFTLTGLHLYLGYRIMHAGGSRYDHKTYMVYSYIFCLMLAFTAGKEGVTLELTRMLQFARS